MTVALLTFALLLSGLDFESSFSAIVAAINNTAHGLGTVGAGQELSFPHRLPDLGLHGRHAPGAPGDFQRDRAVYTGVLA